MTLFDLLWLGAQAYPIAIDSSDRYAGGGQAIGSFCEVGVLIRGQMKRWNSSTISSFPDRSPQGRFQSFPSDQVRPRAELCNPAVFHYACLIVAARH